VSRGRFFAPLQSNLCSVLTTTTAARPLDEGRMLFENWI